MHIVLDGGLCIAIASRVSGRMILIIPQPASEDLKAPGPAGPIKFGFVPALFRHLRAVRRER